MVCYKDLQNLLPFVPHMLTLDSLLCLSILYTLYFNNQNISSTSIKNSITEIKCLNIANISKKLSKFSIEQNVMYYYTRKFSESNSTLLVHLCRVLKIKHTANRIFAVCFIEAHGKGDSQPNAVTGCHLCRVSSFRHTAKIHV